MDREDALQRLPRKYAVAIRLRDEGLDEHQLATFLGIEPEAVGPMLTVAGAKLAGLITEADERPG